MALEYSAVEGKSRNYYLLVGVLGALVLAGLASFIISYLQGHQVFGGSNVVPWGMPIVFLIYLIGLSAGSLIISSLTYVFGRDEYKPIARMAVFMAIVLIVGALIFIMVDLGRPEKFWRLFMFFYLNNMTSMFAINGILYGGYLTISLVYLGLIFANQLKLVKIMGTIAVGWASLVHMGTGAIFGFVAARETWFSPVRPLEFLAAALTSGLALLIVAVTLTLKFTGREVKKEMITSLGKLLTAFIIVLLVLVFVDKMTHYYEPHREAAAYMLAGAGSWVFWVLQIGMGAVIPLAILFNPRLNKTVRWIALAAASVVIGVFFERYYLVITGAAYPLDFYPGEIEGVWGVTGSFPVTPVETMMSVGIIALLGLVFVLGLKYLELLPPLEARAEAPPAKVTATEAAEVKIEEKPAAAESQASST
ncbi:MAG: NrfD/PsrC family molybdoenzyme membrane anchor subunit [Dehalococcoidales bacterium]|nr:NrfD/PsrC family molybdoenzyme membrane anchor subunit [Dehalococcoidales bacterium]MDZ4230777.1 NrfD/PsrC family molybdoenzyme membrane anchor subunit [Dehalococcoidales bacterium]